MSRSVTYRRNLNGGKLGNSLRWKGGQNIKLEGSDRAAVYTNSLEIPSVSQHSTPSLSVRYIPMVGGLRIFVKDKLRKKLIRTEISFKRVSVREKDVRLTNVAHRVHPAATPVLRAKTPK